MRIGAEIFIYGAAYVGAIKSTLPLHLLNSLAICILALKRRTMEGCLAKYIRIRLSSRDAGAGGGRLCILFFF